MTISLEGTFENGQFRFDKPILLADGTVVRVTITPLDEDYDPLEGLIGICQGGPRDGAENHDKYLYDEAFAKPAKRTNQKRQKQAAKRHRGRRP